MARGEADGEDRVGPELALVRRAVELAQPRVECGLVRDVESDQLGTDDRLDVRQRLEHALAAKARRVTVAQLHRLVDSRARATRDTCLADRSVIERDDAFQGRIAARVEDLERGDAFDSAHDGPQRHGQLIPETAENANALEVHVEGELLVGCMDLIVRQPEADEHRLQAP